MTNIKKIAIAGTGGIGSHFISLLFDFGVNRNQFDFVGTQIDAYDADDISSSNLLHQNYTTDDLGKLKVEVMADRYAITPVKRFMTAEDFPNYDLVICCVDAMEFRKSLYEYGWKNKDFLWIDGRCTSHNGFVLNSKLPKKELEEFITDSKERGGCLLQFEKDKQTAHALPIVVAATMLQVFLNTLRGEPSFQQGFTI